MQLSFQTIIPMFFSDSFFILQWWFTFFIVGLIFLPFTTHIFKNSLDKGYIFAKVFGIVAISYIAFLFGVLKLLPFTTPTLFFISAAFLTLNIVIISKNKNWYKNIFFPNIKLFLIEELLFLLTLFFWSYIRGFQPDIHGLEKYMDFGFINSILRSTSFPPKDMWFTPFSINYYYFGHLLTAVLTKLSGLSSAITYNLMVATIFSLSFTLSFSIGINLLYLLFQNQTQTKLKISQKLQILKAGFLSAFLVTMAGNLHAIYTFFKPYPNESPVPFWQLPLSLFTVVSEKLQWAFPNGYWYPNATRFIHNTIHEFPLYSFVVSDLHGHVLSIPIILTIIALLFHMFSQKNKSISIPILIFIAFLIACAYMSNASDGPIYLILTSLVIFYIQLQRLSKLNTTHLFKYHNKLINKFLNMLTGTLGYLFIVVIAFYIFSLPFSFYFKPFISGIGILCAPDFLISIKQLGPLLFEIDHCQKSPLWQIAVLHGFFYFWIICFFIFLIKKKTTIKSSDIFVTLLIFISTLLIVIPEFIYIKDIYPAHYRANTMFKLVYQAFIMLSLCSAYIIFRLINSIQYSMLRIKTGILTVFFLLFSIILLLIVFIYPYLATNSYYGNLQIYKGIDGLSYLKTLYPSDYQAIVWLNKNIKDQPVILEAQGDSYTDFGRFSVNTGLPTVLGWTVHEWLWRGTYDIPAPRIAEIQTMYESPEKDKVVKLLKKYKVSYVVVGDLERQKYPNINNELFKTLGNIVYKNEQTIIYKINY